MGVPAAEPQRRCVGCGRTASKRELLRLVAADGLAVPDPTARRGGRGAYIHRVASSPVMSSSKAAASSEAPPTVDRACLDRAIRRGGLARALRRPVRIAPDLLAGAVDAGAPDGALSSHANHLESIG